MQGIIHFEAFLLAGIILNLTPGNDTIFILTRSLAQGKKAGIMSALGISTGSVIHTILAAFGLSVIIASSTFIFNIIKYLGAAYLAFIGLKMLIGKTQLNTQTSTLHKPVNYLNVYRDGMITNLLNPKVALFFIAFLPQFIEQDLENTVIPFIGLGITFTITGTIWCLILAAFASVISKKLQGNKTISVYVTKICGATLLSLGIKVALTEKK